MSPDHDRGLLLLACEDETVPGLRSSQSVRPHCRAIALHPASMHQATQPTAAAQPAKTTTAPTCGEGIYEPFAFNVPHVYVDISIRPGTTQVTSVVEYAPLGRTTPQQPLHLRGENLELLELSLDGESSIVIVGSNRC